MRPLWGGVVGSIFLSYRSADDAYAAALLDQMLSQVFGSDNVFRASRSIQLGSEYESALAVAVESSSVMLVIVGQGWMERAGSVNGRLGPDDWVRMEICKALELGIVIIPLLLSGVSRLADLHLPDEMRALASIQYLRFDYRNIENDFLRIKREIARYVSEVGESEIDAIAGMLRELADRVERFNDQSK
jgi:TIR domain